MYTKEEAQQRVREIIKIVQDECEKLESSEIRSFNVGVLAGALNTSQMLLEHYSKYISELE